MFANIWKHLHTYQLLMFHSLPLAKHTTMLFSFFLVRKIIRNMMDELIANEWAYQIIKLSQIWSENTENTFLNLVKFLTLTSCHRYMCGCAHIQWQCHWFFVVNVFFRVKRKKRNEWKGDIEFSMKQPIQSQCLFQLKSLIASDTNSINSTKLLSSVQSK